MDQEKVIESVRDEVRRRMSDQMTGHGFDHVQRVVSNALMIHADVGGDRLVIVLAALLHDVGDAKFQNGVERSGEFSREILERLGVAQDVIDRVVAIVGKISFRLGVDPGELTLEGQVVQDADRLDALGAIGIVRTIEYGNSIGQPFYVHGEPTAKSGIDHFDAKLFRLRQLMNTKPAKRIAESREKLMRAFVDQFRAECIDGAHADQP